MKQDIVKQNPQFDNHELVYFFNDKDTGLRGILAIHSTLSGPAVGGTRYFPYGSDEEALEDVLRLSKAMSYKCALAGVKFGGGKCVLIAPSRDSVKSKEYLQAYGKILKEYATTFFTGEDVGMSQEDIEELGKVTPNIIGTRAKAGDPSPWASLSVYYAMRGALRFTCGNPSLKGKVVNIRGLGKVGMELARLVHEDGAILIVSDIDKKRTDLALESFPNTSVIPPSEFYSHECDIFAPCALGKGITDYIAKNIKAKIICGSANNQLESPKEGITLFNRSVVYVPDYVANSGGLINVVAELSAGGYDKNEVLEKCKKIEEQILSILKESKETNIAPNIFADTIAKRILGK
jgi:leucine dehydrogenase